MGDVNCGRKHLRWVLAPGPQIHQIPRWLDYNSAMDNRRQQCIDAVRNTIEASVALREDLVRGEVVGLQMIERLQAGADINECIYEAGENPAELRQTSADAHEFYGRQRHDLRAVFMAAAQESGMSVTEIANRIGVSRQLIQRSVRHPDDEDELSPASGMP